MKRFMKKDNRGFTLVETIVTLIILVILLSVAGLGLTAYIRHANYIRNNNYAETIFYAAQTSLTHYKANGQLKDLQILMDDESKNGANKGMVDISRIKNPEIAGDQYENRLYYLMISKDSTRKDEASQALLDLLSDYIYDSSILDASICLEFDPYDGTVYSAIYSDRQKAFTYGESSDSETGISDRSEEFRKDKSIGFYNVDMSNAAPGSKGKTAVSRVQLVNDERLTLNWAMSKEFEHLSSFLSYSIDIYDSDAKKPMLSLAVNSDVSGQPEKDNWIKAYEPEEDSLPGITDTRNRIYCDVTWHSYDAGGNDVQKVIPSVPFYAYGEEDNSLTIVLDALDLAALKAPAPDEVDQDTNTEKETFSITRLGLQAENIYARVQASGKPYKTSAWKQSGPENALFADKKTDEKEPGAVTYTVKNFRHLNNIRYMEEAKETAAEKITYIQAQDLIWAGEKGILERGYVYENGQKPAGIAISPEFPEGAAAAFVPIPELKRNSAVKVETGLLRKKYKISGLLLYEAPSLTVEPAGYLGLFRINSGTVENLTFRTAVAAGEDYVGIVCGWNAGNLAGINVAGNVSGGNYVGGIAGYMEPPAAAGTGAGARAEKCESYAAVKGREADSFYIGGIAGYNKGGTIKECISAPAGNPYDEEGRLDSAKLTGMFVGGIVGYNDHGYIENCGTVNRDENEKNAAAYVIGNRFVGGIAGYNAGKAEADGGEYMIAGSRKNQAGVVGTEYVGGIIGVNGELDIPDDFKPDQAAPDFEEQVKAIRPLNRFSKEVVVKGWVNEGIITACGYVEDDTVTDPMASDVERPGYAGGIAGFNAGILEGCYSKVNSANNGKDLVDEAYILGGTGDYAGGIAGYNCGYIDSGESELIVRSIVGGRNYVGGVVGANAQAEDTASGSDSAYSGRITGYVLGGGYIRGENFTGGYIGLNTTPALFTDIAGKQNRIQSNPNLVEGSYYVGGAFGGLIMAADADQEIVIDCSVNNFLGDVVSQDTEQPEKGACAGGYAGYTCLTLNDRSATARIGDMVRRLSAVGSVEDILAEDLAGSHTDGRLVFEGRTDEYNNRLKGVTAPLYAGGVVGYNVPYTRMEIRNIQNSAIVQAQRAVADPALDDREDVTFSYAGGIAGIVTQKMVIDNCRNVENGKVLAKGYYTGGLAEVNLGTIRNCGNIGSLSGSDHIGSVAGLNKGTVQKCTLTGQVTGGSDVGGLVAYNDEEGLILDSGVSYKGQDSAVRGTGKNVGGVAAQNRGTITACFIRSSVGVSGTGENIGGITGLNLPEGRIYQTAAYADDKPVVAGADNVGGLAGYNQGNLRGVRDSDDQMLLSYDVQATSGRAGGIAGYQDQTGQISGWITSGTVQSDSGLAGGISAENGGRILNCTYAGIVRASGDVGGITARNNENARIESSRCKSFVETIQVQGAGYVGGIAGWNNGMIKGCWLDSAIKVSNSLTAKAENYIGGIAGYNQAVIEDAGRTGNVKQVTDAVIVSNVNGSSIGGVAGYNGPGAQIRSSDGQIRVMDPSVELGAQSLKGNIGGITGANLGNISDYSYAGTVSTYTGGTAYGIGGIAGINGSDTQEAVIENCYLDGTVIGKTSSTFDNKLSGGFLERGQDAVFAGGIAGQNKKMGTIRGSGLKSTASSEVSLMVANGYSGGITGDNYGIITDSGASGYENSSFPVWLGDRAADNKNGRGILGGITGINGPTGRLTGCSTGSDWNIVNNYSKTEGDYAGGIAGVNQSGYEILECENRAVVYGGWGAGGIVGGQVNRLNSGTLISKCTNRGSVNTTYSDSGGIVGHWRDLGGTVSECVNYGEISTNGNDSDAGKSLLSVGGIIGSGWINQNGIKINVIRCGNEGSIHGKNTGNMSVAGICGAFNTNQNKLNLFIADCYNAGLIGNSKGERASGITAGAGKKANLNIKLYRCVNYGLGSDTGKSFYGIGDISGSTFDMNYCLNTSKTTMASGLNGKNNYYIGYDKGQNNSGPPYQLSYYNNSGNKNFWNDTNCSANETQAQLTLKTESKDWAKLQFQKLYLPDEYGYDASQIKQDFSQSSTVHRDFNGDFDIYRLVYSDPAGALKQLNMPWTAQVTPGTDDFYTLSWKPDTATQLYTDRYEIVITGKKDGDGAPVFTKTIYASGMQDLMEFRLGEECDTFDISIRAVCDDGRYAASDVITLKDQKARKTLPAPELVLYLGYQSAGRIEGNLMIENQEDYADIPGWKIEVYSGNSTTPLTDSKTGQKSINQNNDHIYTQGSTADYTFRAVASADGYNSSQFSSMQYIMSPNSVLKAAVTNQGTFRGTSAEDFKYQMQMRMQDTGSHRSIVYRVDMIIRDQTAGKDSGRVIASSIASLQRNGALADVELELTSEEQIDALMNRGAGEEVIIRYYPWESGIAKYYYPKNGQMQSTVLEHLNDYSSYGEYAAKGLPARREPAPQIDPNYTVDESTGRAVYRFQWDQGNLNPNGYEVMLTGYSGAAGAEIQTVLYPRQKLNTNLLQIDGTNWNYSRVELSVTRNGQEGVSVSSTGSAVYPLTLRLPSVTRPTASLTDVDELKYRISWSGLTDTSALAGYTLIFTKQGDTSVKASVSVGAAVTQKEVQIESGELSVFKAGDTILVSVTAVAKPNSGYQNSYTSDAVTVIVPARMEPPAVSGFGMYHQNSSGTDQEAGSYPNLPLDEFENPGFKFRVTGAAGDGYYKCEYAVRDGKTSDYEPGGTDTESAVMRGTLSSSELTFGNLSAGADRAALGPENAGKYLWLRVRSASDGQVSSNWTGWQIYQLPKGLLDVPSWTYAEQTVEHSETRVLGLDGASSVEKIRVNHPVLSFRPVRFAKQYDLELIQQKEAGDGSGGPSQEETYRFRIGVDSGGAPAVNVLNADGSLGAGLTGASRPDAPQTQVFTLYENTLTGTDTAVQGTYQYTLKLQAVLSVTTDSTGNISYQLQLPDGSEVDASGNEKGGIHENTKPYAPTRKAVIQAVPDDTGRYEVMEKSAWIQTDSGYDIINEPVPSGRSAETGGDANG